MVSEEKKDNMFKIAHDSGLIKVPFKNKVATINIKSHEESSELKRLQWIRPNAEYVCITQNFINMMLIKLVNIIVSISDHPGLYEFLDENMIETVKAVIS